MKPGFIQCMLQLCLRGEKFCFLEVFETESSAAASVSEHVDGVCNRWRQYLDGWKKPVTGAKITCNQQDISEY